MKDPLDKARKSKENYACIFGGSDKRVHTNTADDFENILINMSKGVDKENDYHSRLRTPPTPIFRYTRSYLHPLGSLCNRVISNYVRL